MRHRSSIDDRRLLELLESRLSLECVIEKLGHPLEAVRMRIRSHVANGVIQGDMVTGPKIDWEVFDRLTEGC